MLLTFSKDKFVANSKDFKNKTKPHPIGNLLFLGFCLCVFWILGKANEKYDGQARLNLRDVEMPEFVYEVPGGAHNYRSAQLSLEQLETVLRNGAIRTVVRLNGNGKDSGGVSAEQEKALCEKFNTQFLLIDSHRKDAPQIIHNLFSEGQCLIHCRHGFDRTGAMVGYHLRQIGYSRDEVIRHNGWENYLECKGRAYAGYFNLIQ